MRAAPQFRSVSAPALLGTRQVNDGVMDATGVDESGGDGARSYAMLILKIFDGNDPLTLAICFSAFVLVVVSLASLLWYAVWNHCTARERQAEYEAIAQRTYIADMPEISPIRRAQHRSHFDAQSGSYAGAGAEVHTQFEDL